MIKLFTVRKIFSTAHGFNALIPSIKPPLRGAEMKSRKYIVILILTAAALLCASGSAAWRTDGGATDNVTVPCVTTF